MKKYEFTDETKKSYGRILHRIRAVRDFSDVKRGDTGGFIEKGKNLSHDDNAWVYDNAVVCDDAMVCDSAIVRDNAMVCDSAIVRDNALVRDSAIVRENALVCCKAIICGNSWVHGSAWVGGNTETHGIWIFGDARIYSNKDLKEMEIRNERRINRRIQWQKAKYCQK